MRPGIIRSCRLNRTRSSVGRHALAGSNDRERICPLCMSGLLVVEERGKRHIGRKMALF
jgi:hypothetical protein